MTVEQLSPHPGFRAMTREYDGSSPPPPWPVGPDPRTDRCRHDWNGEWGQKGERQHLCMGCLRWVWDRAIWPADA